MNFFVFVLSSLLTINLFAEVIDAPSMGVNFDQAPSELDWKMINTEHFEIVFPAEVEKKAQRVAHLLERAYPFVSRSLEVTPKKVQVILHNQSMTSNGFVSLAPLRSEWFLTPATDTELSNTDWLKTLAIHEFRHVVQFEKSKQGFNRVYQILFGQIGEALGIGMTMPQWFLEGDAVGIETALTIGGRGRLPIFDRDLRALLLAGKKYSYDKSYFGSYKDYQPNHYVYGYFLTSWFRNHFGDLVLSKIIDDATDRSYNPLSFYHAVERVTNKNFEVLYKAVMNDLFLEWSEKAKELNLTPYNVLNLGKKKVWTNYFYPQVLEDGRIFALKRGLSDIAQFVVLDGEKEETLFYPAPLQEFYPFQVRAGRVAFFETELDGRWGLRDYSRLKVYDIKKDQFILNQSGGKGRLAVLDPKGEKVLYVLWDEKQDQFIVVSDLEGKETFRKKISNDGVITSIDWLNETEIVYVYKNEHDLKSVEKMDLVLEQSESLVQAGPVNIGSVIVSEGEVFLESSSSGIDNIFLLKNKNLIQITSSLNGAYAPTLSKGELVYNDYTYLGMNIVKKKIDWQEEQKSQDSFYPIYERFAKTERGDLFESSETDNQTYPVQEYSKLKNSINFHSWLIFAPPLSSTLTLAGISRDTFNTFSLALGADYHIDERTLQGFVSATWSNYFPVFDLRAAYGGRRIKYKTGSESTWEEGSLEGGVSVPWTYLSGRFSHSFTLRAFGRIIKVENKNHAAASEIANGTFLAPGAEFQYRGLSRQARRDLNPLGFTFGARFDEGRDISGDNQKGRRYLLDGRLYLPGLIDNHSFYHQLAYEKQDPNTYEFSSLVSTPRGLKNIFVSEYHKYSGNYTFPIFYPDWNLHRFIYFKRVAGNLFYDELNGREKGMNYFASSYGWEVLTEMNLLRIFVPITIGVRGSYPIKGIEDENNYEVFLASNFSIF